MNPTRFVAAALVSCLSSAAMASSHLIYFGTYSNPPSRGIYMARMDEDTGKLTEPALVAELRHPTWVEFSRDNSKLYTVHGSPAQAVGFAVDSTTGKLAPLPTSESANGKAGNPCHIAIDAKNRVLVTSNYGGGSLASMLIAPDGTLGEPHVIKHAGSGPDPKRQEGPHVHSATFSPDNRFVIVCDLGLDKIITYSVDHDTGKLTPANEVKTEPGAGPRHFKFGRDGRSAYAVMEMGGTVVAYQYTPETGALTPIQTLSTLPADFTGLKWVAEVRVHPNGRFLYVSNRTHDSIAAYAIDRATGKLRLIEIVPSGGKTPRNFALSPSGKWLVTAHQDSGDVCVFAVDATSGQLRQTDHRINVPSSICVAFPN